MIKNTLGIVVISILFCLQTNAQTKQTASVEESVWEIQTGFLGVWGYKETKLSNSIALRTEVGFDSDIFSSPYYERGRANFVMTPVITAEPRWYYNLSNRVEKGYDIDHNNGNFVSLDISFHPGILVISNVDNLEVIPDLSIVPKWGIRRTLGRHFSYEVGIGIGYQRIFYDSEKYYFFDSSDKNNGVIDLHLRIGYTF
jgi:hypothetical protein